MRNMHTAVQQPIPTLSNFRLSFVLFFIQLFGCFLSFFYFSVRALQSCHESHCYLMKIYTQNVTNIFVVVNIGEISTGVVRDTAYSRRANDLNANFSGDSRHRELTVLTY